MTWRMGVRVSRQKGSHQSHPGCSLTLLLPAGVIQLVEWQPSKLFVAGSSPVSCSIYPSTPTCSQAMHSTPVTWVRIPSSPPSWRCRLVDRTRQLINSVSTRVGKTLFFAGIAQLVEHQLPKLAVASSSLVSRSYNNHTVFWGGALLVQHSDLYSEAPSFPAPLLVLLQGDTLWISHARRFDSYHLRHSFSGTTA